MRTDTAAKLKPAQKDPNVGIKAREKDKLQDLEQ